MRSLAEEPPPNFGREKNRGGPGCRCDSAAFLIFFLLFSVKIYFLSLLSFFAPRFLRGPSSGNDHGLHDGTDSRQKVRIPTQRVLTVGFRVVLLEHMIAKP